MTKTRVLLSIAFVLALLAGGAVGVVGSRAIPARGDETPRPPHERKPWLTGELNLSAAQEAQMKEIWSPMSRGGPRDHFERFRAAEKSRDEAIVGLLSHEQKARYDQIQAEHQAAMEQLGQERERSFQQAVEATKKILNDEQRQKYEQIMARRQKGGERGERGERRGPGGPGGFGPPPPPPEPATERSN